MMNQETLAPHETLELHEILRFKQTEVKKAFIMNAINIKKNQRGELEQFIKAKGILQ